MKRIILLSTFATSLFLGSCSRDKTEPTNNNNNSNPPNKTPQELLIGTWQTSSMLWNGQEAIEDCQKDNLITFNADGT